MTRQWRFCAKYQVNASLGERSRSRFPDDGGIGYRGGLRTARAQDGVSAALILADKTDVRRNRVQNRNKATFDIHDRVNYAALSSKLIIEKEKRIIQMELELDDSICTVMDYFEIFLKRMIMCRRAAECLNCKFKLMANGSKLC